MGRHGLLAWIALLSCLALGTAALAVDRTGSAQSERIVGTNGDDQLDGAGGDDNLIGKGGRDVLIGGGGEDRLTGDGGRDSFNMTKDGQTLSAPGRDRIYARDGHPDSINCGAGRDLAVVDTVEDGLYDCEVVTQP
jgi:Ca2+-binding RTX toxin-like protein